MLARQIENMEKPGKNQHQILTFSPRSKYKVHKAKKGQELALTARVLRSKISHRFLISQRNLSYLYYLISIGCYGTGGGCIAWEQDIDSILLNHLNHHLHHLNHQIEQLHAINKKDFSAVYTASQYFQLNIAPEGPNIGKHILPAWIAPFQHNHALVSSFAPSYLVSINIQKGPKCTLNRTLIDKRRSAKPYSRNRSVMG